ncbi:selenoprotein S-like [Oratosquilla oratoria]|uniref:selenoprotein S-like n=1 Tax=Oratosquilla oratoria TaxID=337810 RepID=UPI003F75A938
MGEEGQPPVVEPDHPPTLEQQNPWLLRQFFSHSFVALSSYGWYVVTAIFIGVIVWRRVRPLFMKWKKKKEDEQEAAEFHKNPDVFISRELAIEAARQRMQDEYSRAAAAHAVKIKELEEKKQQERLENMEAQMRGEGRSRSKLSTATSVPSSSSPSKPSGKAKLRPEYNPLMGGGGACGYRPARRSGGGG